MSWDRTHKHRRSLALKTTNSMLSANSPTSAPPSLTTSRWTQISTIGWEGSFNSPPSQGSSVDKPQAVCEDKDGSLNCLCYQHIAVWQRDVDDAGQERRLKTFHLRSIRRILGISWQDKVTNADALSRAGLPTMYTLLRQRRLRWLEDGRIPKDILYGELALGRRTTGRPHLRDKDVCGKICEGYRHRHYVLGAGLAADRTTWRSALKHHLKTGEDKLTTAAADKRARRKEGSSFIRPETTHRCLICDKDCHSHIGIFSQKTTLLQPGEKLIKLKTKTNSLGCIIRGHL